MMRIVRPLGLSRGLWKITRLRSSRILHKPHPSGVDAHHAAGVVCSAAIGGGTASHSDALGWAYGRQ